MKSFPPLSFLFQGLQGTVKLGNECQPHKISALKLLQAVLCDESWVGAWWVEDASVICLGKEKSSKNRNEMQN